MTCTGRISPPRRVSTTTQQLAHLQEEAADGHEVRLQGVLELAVWRGAAPLQPQETDGDLAGVVHVPAPAALVLGTDARPA